MEQVGINNILSKRYGSTNPLNIVRATINALENLQDAVLVANKRGMTMKELFGAIWLNQKIKNLELPRLKVE